MNPITTFQGLNLRDYDKRLNGKKVVIWGCGPLGYAIKLQLIKCLNRPSTFTSNSSSESEYFKPYLKSHEAIRLASSSKALILIANVSHRANIKKHLLNQGLIRGDHFLDYFDIPRPEIGIDVNGDGCNMEVDKFSSIVEKLENELRSAINLEIGVFNNPLDHPDIRNISHKASKYFFTTIRIPVLDPEYFLILQQCNFHHIIFDIDDSVTQKKLHKAFELILALRRKAKLQIENMQSFVTFLINITNNNKKNLSTETEIFSNCKYTRLRQVLKQIDDYPKLLNLVAAEDNPTKHFKHLKWDLNLELNNAKKESKKKCLCQRIFPVIDASNNVLHCHLYNQPILQKDYSRIALKKLVIKRSINEHCSLCQSYGLHRLDVS